jgi:predicted house-cleaning NTP pyrophosphatase (Maf/HAM1 superfamily)
VRSPSYRPKHYSGHLELGDSPEDLIKQAGFWLEVLAPLKMSGILVAAQVGMYYRNKNIGQHKYKMDAFEILKSLDGTSHQVVVGWQIYHTKSKQKRSGISEARVFFKQMGPQVWEGYVNDQPVHEWLLPYNLAESNVIKYVDKVEGPLSTALYLLPVPDILAAMEEF